MVAELMETYLALLRGINVSGHNMVSMDALKKTLGNLGFSNVRSYIQSGNIIFETAMMETGQLVRMISEAIFHESGLGVPVVIRTRPDLERIGRNNPFLNDRNANTDHLHVSFLAEKPGDDLVGKTSEFRYLPDEFFIVGKEIYLFCPGGYGRTKLTNQFFENRLKTIVTTRNWKTIIKLAQMMNNPW